jgi:putative peptide zinc metalloprotease protein
MKNLKRICSSTKPPERRTMSDFQITDASKVTFHPLYRGEEEDGFVVVGRPEIDSFVSIPAEAVEVIDLLDSGKSVGQVKKMLNQKYEAVVVVEEFVQDMIENELVHYIDSTELVTTSPPQKDLFSWISADHVGWMFSTYAQVCYAAAAVGSVVLFAVFPEYIPQPEDYFFHPWYSVAVGFMFFFGWGLVAIHEVAHLFAAKAVGTGGYFSLGYRLVFVVAQTHVSNIWKVPRKKRYIIFFAGMAWDSTIVFVCLIVLLLHDYRILGIPELIYHFLKAVIFIKVWSILWQFRFNMRTDIYNALVNYSRCRNLMGDARTYMKNKISQLWGKKAEDMEGIPDHEMKAIKFYAPLYVVGTGVTLVTFFFRRLLVLVLQVIRAFEGFTAGYSADPRAFADAVILILLNGFYYGLLLYLILRPRWGGLKQVYLKRIKSFISF